MDLKKTFLLVFAILLFVVGGTLLFYSTYVIERTAVFPMDIDIDDRSGMNGNPDGLHFGVIPPGAFSIQKVNVSNDGDHDVQVVVRLSGSIAPIIDVPQSGLVLKPGEVKEISFTAKPPLDFPYGRYEGKARVIIQRV